MQIQEFLTTGKLALLEGGAAGGDELPAGGAKPNPSKPDAGKAMALTFM